MDKLSSVSPVADKASSDREEKENITKEPCKEDSVSRDTLNAADSLGKKCRDDSVTSVTSPNEVAISEVTEKATLSSGHTSAKQAREPSQSSSSMSGLRNRSRSYGNLLTGTNGTLSSRKKEILVSLIMRLRFEEKHRKQQAGRDFTGPIQLNQFFREFCLYFIYLTTGPLSLLVLMPLLGKKIAKAKLFIPNSRFMGPYLRMLATAMCFPLIILHLLLKTGSMSRHIFWSDLFVPSIFVLNYCMLNALKYGYQDPVNYKARSIKSEGNDSKVPRKKIEKSFSITSAFKRNRGRLGRSEMTKKEHELKKLSESPAVAVLLFSGMVGNSYERQRVANQEVEWASSNILNMESDSIIIPTGLYKSQSVAGRMSVVQNARSLTHRVDLLTEEKHRGNNKDMARKKSISTKEIAHAITSAAIHEFDDKVDWEPTAQKNLSLYQKVVTAVRSWVFVYFCARMYVMYTECEGALSSIHWSTYLVILACTIAPFAGGHFWAVHAATPFCEFRRRYYMESKLSMLIHQMDVYSTADVDAWRRLRLCLQEMGSPYYSGMSYYNAYTVLSCMAYMFFLGLFTIFDIFSKPSKVSYNYICIPLVYFNLMIQFLVLLGMREGSRVNRVAIDHVQEWIKVQQRLNRDLEKEKDELDQILDDIAMCEDMKAGSVPQQGDDESSKSLEDEIAMHKERMKSSKLTIRQLKSAKDSAHLLCEELQLAITFRGMRMFSMRLSKILFKTLFVVFLYEAYYSTLYYLFDGDMSNIYSI